MKKRIHLICNAHLDPVWQWEWEEGAAEALSTFRVAARLCEEYGDFVFNHNEAILYQWVEEYEPALFEKIQQLVAAGKWHIMGGTYLQPDCNMPSGEGQIRQILEGRRYFMDKFGVRPTTSVNFDAFGHSRGQVQILKKCGYDSTIFGRPFPSFVELPGEEFRWVGYDGSEIIGRRFVGYNSFLGKATEKIQKYIDKCPEDDFTLCLWGVGNHGGGPSKKDLEDIARLQKEMEAQGVQVIHSTLENYFAELKESGKELPAYEGELNPWGVGCYTSMIRVKQKYRQFENMLFSTEKMCAAASLNGVMPWPKAEINEAVRDLLTVQFHDILPGTSVQSAEEMGLRVMDHGMEILTRVRTRAFFALSAGQKPATADAIPILIFNPNPYPVEGDFACEMMLWDQNHKGTFNTPRVRDESGTFLPTQCEKENSSIKLDWRKKVVFHGTLKPMQMNRFDCYYDELPTKPVPQADREDADAFYLESDCASCVVSKTTGALLSYKVGGKELLSGESCVLHVVEDNCDPWEMSHVSFEKRIGTFTLMSPEDGSVYSGVLAPIPSVRCIESGPVRVVIEAVLSYEHSRAVIRYTMPRKGAGLGIDVRVSWAEIQRMLKMEIRGRLPGGRCLGEAEFGLEDLPVNGRENVSLRYLRMENVTHGLLLANNGIYGSSCEASAEGLNLYATLLRSAAYCAHPVGTPDIIAQDRFTPHMEQGERQYSFVLLGGTLGEVEASASVVSGMLNDPPMALSFYPPSDGKRPSCPVQVSGPVELSCFKMAEDGEGYILRFYNPSAALARFCVNAPAFGVRTELEIGKFSADTYRITHGCIAACDMTEGL